MWLAAIVELYTSRGSASQSGAGVEASPKLDTSSCYGLEDRGWLRRHVIEGNFCAAIRLSAKLAHDK